MAVGFAVNIGMNALSLAGLVKWPVMADPILVGVVCSYIAVAVVSRAGLLRRRNLPISGACISCQVPSEILRRSGKRCYGPK